MTAKARDAVTSLRRGFSWAFAGRAVYAATQWLVLVVMAKTATPETVGRFGLAVAIAAPVFSLLNLELRTIAATDAKAAYRPGDYIALRITSAAVAVSVVVLMAVSLGYAMELRLLIVAVGAAKAVESLADVLSGIIQQQERMDFVGRSLTLKGVALLSSVVPVMYLTGSLTLSVVAWAALWTAVLTLYDLPNARRVVTRSSALAPTWDWRAMGRLAWLATPLGVMVVLISLNTNVPRYFVVGFQGEAALGYFTALGYLLVAGTTLTGALYDTAGPRLARYYDAEPALFVKLWLQLTGFAAALGLLGLLVAAAFGRPLLRIVYGPTYSDYADVLVWMMLAAIFMYMFAYTSAALTVMRRFRLQAGLAAAGLVTNLLVSMVAVPVHGLRGAAWALLASALLNFVAGSLIIAISVAARRRREAKKQPAMAKVPVAPESGALNG